MVKTINMPAFASMLGAAKGAGFDTENILHQVVLVFMGGSAAAIPGQLVKEIADVVENFGKDYMGTTINTMAGGLMPVATFKAIGYVLDAFGLPKRRKFGEIVLVWAL